MKPSLKDRFYRHNTVIKWAIKEKINNLLLSPPFSVFLQCVADHSDGNRSVANCPFKDKRTGCDRQLIVKDVGNETHCLSTIIKIENKKEIDWSTS